MTKSAAAKKAVETEAPAPAAPQPVAAAEEKQKPIVALLASEFRPRESGVYFNTHEAVPAAGTPLEDILRPEFWANVAQKLRLGDTILALPRDGKFYAELLVWDAGQNWAQVAFKGEPMLRPKFTPLPGVASDFEIGHDPIDGVVIRRRSTGAMVKGNFSSHEDARKWIIDNQAALRR